MSPLEKGQSLRSSVIPPVWTLAFAVLLAAGAFTFLWAISGPLAFRAWQAYLTNYVHWTGLAFGAVLFSAVLNLTDAQWGRPLKRLAEAPGAFLPFAFLLLWVLYPGRGNLFIRTPEVPPEKVAWLSPGFLFARDGSAILVLTALSLALIYFSVKGDRRWVAEGPDGAGWKASWRYQRILSPILGIAYAFILSLLAFDLIMSLDPHWYSTLFGAYYFITCFYSALAGIYLLSLLLRKTPGLDAYLRPRHFHDMGKLVLAFCLLTGYLFFVQLMVIWYGNISEETEYLILRVKLPPWEPLAWTVLFLMFIGPFVVLLSRDIKKKPIPMMILSSFILTGIWLERFLLVAPSLWKGRDLPLGFVEVFITAGFVGLMGLCVIFFLRRVPPVPLSDPMFRKSLEEIKRKDVH
jgi:hypothetical protein